MVQGDDDEGDQGFTLADLGGDVPAGPDEDDTDVNLSLADYALELDDEPDADDGPSVLEMLGE